MVLAILCELFGMVKWPFSMVKWSPTRGWKGHFESPAWSSTTNPYSGMVVTRWTLWELQFCEVAFWISSLAISCKAHWRYFDRCAVSELGIPFVSRIPEISLPWNPSAWRFFFDRSWQFVSWRLENLSPSQCLLVFKRWRQQTALWYLLLDLEFCIWCNISWSPLLNILYRL